MINWMPQQEMDGLNIYDIQEEIRLEGLGPTNDKLCQLFEKIDNYPPFVNTDTIKSLLEEDLKPQSRDDLVKLLGAESEELKWSPYRNPVKEFTRHLIAQKVNSLQKKRLLVLPSTIGRDIQLFRAYNICADRCKWLAIEREKDVLRQFKTLVSLGSRDPNRFFILPPEQLEDYGLPLHDLNERLVRGDNIVDFAWFDFWGNIDIKELDFLAHRFEIKAESNQDLFFTFAHAQQNSPGTLFSMMKELCFNDELSFMRKAFDIEEGISSDLLKMIMPNKEGYSYRNNNYKSKTKKFDESILVHFNMLKYILSKQGCAAEIDCFFYKQNPDYLQDFCSARKTKKGKAFKRYMVIYHIRNIRKLSEDEKNGSGAYYMNYAIDALKNIFELYRNGGSSKDMAEDKNTYPPSGDSFSPDQMSRWKQVNSLTASAEEYRFSTNFMALLRDTEATSLPEFTIDEARKIFFGDENTLKTGYLSSIRQCFSRNEQWWDYVRYALLDDEDWGLSPHQIMINAIKDVTERCETCGGVGVLPSGGRCPASSRKSKKCINGRYNLGPGNGFELVSRFLRQKNKEDGGDRRYRIIVRHETSYINYDPEIDPYTITITRHFLLPENRDKALFSIFRYLFKGDPYLHPQLVGSIPDGQYSLATLRQELDYISSKGLDPHFLRNIRDRNQIKCISPTEPQVQALANWKDSFEENIDVGGVIVLPTGMGKTNVAVEIMKYCLRKQLRVLFIAHVNELLDQAIDRFVTNYDGNPRHLIPRIGLIQAESSYTAPNDTRKLLSRRRGSGPTTESYYLDEINNPHRKILFAGARVLSGLIQRGVMRADIADVIIIDEVHHDKAAIYYHPAESEHDLIHLTNGRKIRCQILGHGVGYLTVQLENDDVPIRIEERDIEHIEHVDAHPTGGILHHFNEPYSPDINRLGPYLLGLTATPWRTDTQSVIDLMGNRILYQMQLHTAIYMGYLCNPVIRTWMVTDSMINRRQDDPIERSEWKRLIYEAYRDEITTERRTIAFCGGTGEAAEEAGNYLFPRSLTAMEIADIFAAFDPSLEMRVITSNTIYDPVTGIETSSSLTARKEVLDALGRGDIDIVFVFNILNEGIDVPTVDALLFIRTTTSSVKQFQQCGRGLRLAYDKKSTLVWDLEMNANRLTEFYESSYFEFMSKRRGEGPHIPPGEGPGERRRRRLDVEIHDYVIQLSKKHMENDDIMRRMVQKLLEETQDLGFGPIPWSEYQIIEEIGKHGNKMVAQGLITQDDFIAYTAERIKVYYYEYKKSLRDRFKNFKKKEMLSEMFHLLLTVMVDNNLLSSSSQAAAAFWKKKNLDARKSDIYQYMRNIEALLDKEGADVFKFSNADLNKIYNRIEELKMSGCNRWAQILGIYDT